MASEGQKGVVAVVAACVIWGFAPLFYHFLKDIPPSDVLAHRIFWSMVVFLVMVAMTGQLGRLRFALTNKRELGWIGLAAFMISFNWFFFIVAVLSEHVTYSSLAYFMAPLLSVLLGVVFFREIPSVLQRLAVGLAALAVIVLTFGLGAPPGLSLTMAVTFAAYGAIKKIVTVSGAVSVTAETIIMLPLVLGWLVFFSETPIRLDWTLLLLILSGPLTAGPLILFSYAAQRIPLPTLGILQYINPSLQFLCALFIFSEPMTVWHAIAFPLIWLGLALYSWSSFTAERRARRIVP